MNEHAGPASALSVLIVGLFAILLHDRQPSPTPSPTPSSSQATAKDARIESIASPKPTPAVVETRKSAPPIPSGQNVVAQSTPKLPVIPVPRATPPVPASGQATSPAPTTGVPPVVERPSAPRPARTLPRSPFTVVEAGEKLADIARRIYGTPEAADTLWRANRDQVAMIDSPLSQGTLLRTP